MNAADPFNDPEWTFIMACAWVADRTRGAVEAAARGYSGIKRAAVERLLRDLRGGRLTAWARVDGKTFPIAPEHWRALEPTFTRVRFLPGFAETFSRLIVTVRDGMEQDIRNLTILSEAMQQIFPADAAVIAAPVRRRNQAQRDRARMGLEGRFGQEIPPPTEISNGVLCREVVKWLAEHHPLPPGNSEISNDSILRAAARKQ